MEQINDTVKFTWRTSFPLPGISRATPVLYHTDEILLSERRAMHVFFAVLWHIIQFYRLIIVKKGRTHWSAPTEEKILCRSPISQRSHVGNLRQTLQGKGVIHKRVETAGVYPLVRPRGVSALPAEVQRKTPRPERANTPAAVRVPRWVGAEKEPPIRGEHANAVRAPRLSGAEKEPPRQGEPACGSSRTPLGRC